METNEKFVAEALDGDLDFHDQASDYASHNFHSFPAKFAPQLPEKFIKEFTVPGQLVLDPMAGSGTTLVEAMRLGRIGIGFDIDHLAVLLAAVKVNKLDANRAYELGKEVLKRARKMYDNGRFELEFKLTNFFDEKTKKFVNYWFSQETQLQLIALVTELQKVQEEEYRKFLQLVFSSTIITKTGGVSLAFDLAHTRPHRAKVAIARNGEVLFGKDLVGMSERIDFLTKKERSTFGEFKKRLQKNVKGLLHVCDDSDSFISYGNAERLPLKTNSIDLIVTSPPYASNAIDYMRAHKFSLVWFGKPIDSLSDLRGEYIGGEATFEFDFEPIPAFAESIIEQVSTADEKKGRVLRRYYSEMSRVLEEMHRVLKTSAPAFVVVGNSVMRDISTETAECLAEIGRDIGFRVPGIGIRNLDRNRRMMPVGKNGAGSSQIQQRMHEEYVIGFLKNE